MTMTKIVEGKASCLIVSESNTHSIYIEGISKLMNEQVMNKPALSIY
jgi:hypothetical protein